MTAQCSVGPVRSGLQAFWEDRGPDLRSSPNILRTADWTALGPVFGLVRGPDRAKMRFLPKCDPCMHCWQTNEPHGYGQCCSQSSRAPAPILVRFALGLANDKKTQPLEVDTYSRLSYSSCRASRNLPLSEPSQLRPLKLLRRLLRSQRDFNVRPGFDCRGPQASKTAGMVPDSDSFSPPDFTAPSLRPSHRRFKSTAHSFLHYACVRRLALSSCRLRRPLRSPPSAAVSPPSPPRSLPSPCRIFVRLSRRVTYAQSMSSPHPSSSPARYLSGVPLAPHSLLSSHHALLTPPRSRVRHVHCMLLLAPRCTASRAAAHQQQACTPPYLYNKHTRQLAV
jgi:hypothetical protein